MNDYPTAKAVTIENLLEMEPLQKPTAVAIGVFDGVHIGHQALLSELCGISKEHNLSATALTFVRHPADVLEAENAPKHICSLEERVERLRKACSDTVVVARFDHKLANISPEDFFKRILLEKFKASAAVVGPDFRFGKDRSGDISLLSELADSRGVMVKVVPPVFAYGEIVSSTRIRRLVEDGDIEMAAKLLGRRFSLTGKVGEGEGIGRQLKCPTANVETDRMQLVPKVGVYTAEAEVGGNKYKAAVNVDFRPALNPYAPLVEVHLIGFCGNIYGEPIYVEFKRRLRDKIKFNSREDLIRQIAQDVSAAASDP